MVSIDFFGWFDVVTLAANEICPNNVETLIGEQKKQRSIDIIGKKKGKIKES